MGLTTNHAGTAESTCCILPEIKSFLLLSDVTNVTPSIQHGRKGGPPPESRHSMRPTWMPAKPVDDSSDSSGCYTVAHHHSSSAATTAGNPSPPDGGSQQLQSFPLGPDSNIDIHTCGYATARYFFLRWPGHRLSSRDG